MVRTASAVIIAFAFALAGGAAAPAGAQETATGWVAVQIYACPSWMTADTLDPWSCWLQTEGVDFYLATGDGTRLLGLGDAVFDGWTWTWQWLAVGSAEVPVPYQVVQAVAPAGAVSAVVRYAPNEGDASTVWLSAGAAGADLHVYNFF